MTPAFLKQHKEQVEARQRAGVAAPSESPDMPYLVPDLNRPDRVRALGQMLRKGGHSAKRVEKIMGGNFVRAFGEICGA